MTTTTRNRRDAAPGVLFAALPGPTRKRTPSPYCYRLLFEGADPQQAGCILLWEVLGGREVYQIALERLAGGRLHWHCTCADAVYRGDGRPHVCKHVRGLKAQGRSQTEVNLLCP